MKFRKAFVRSQCKSRTPRPGRNFLPQFPPIIGDLLEEAPQILHRQGSARSERGGLTRGMADVRPAPLDRFLERGKLLLIEGGPSARLAITRQPVAHLQRHQHWGRLWAAAQDVAMPFGAWTL
jgi:hypothetical protein